MLDKGYLNSDQINVPADSIVLIIIQQESHLYGNSIYMMAS